MHDFANVKFLLVEDNDLDAERLERAFRRLNLTNVVIRAKNGYEALETLRGNGTRKAVHSPFVILLDLNMPKMNGLELLSEIRNDPALKSSPVFVLSTSDRRLDINDAFDYNVCGYIVKPISQDRMTEALSVLEKFWSLGELPEPIAVESANENV